MQKITKWIFEQSPKKLAILLVLLPLVLFLLHTLTTIVFRTNSTSESIEGSFIQIILGMLLLIIITVVLLWLFWLRSVVYDVSEPDLGIPRKWFNMALVLFVLYLIYNLCFSFIAEVNEDYRYIFYALNEFIGLGGLLIAYPTMCYYAARAVVIKRGIKPVTLMNALPFALLLFFGTVLSIPFLHKYFSTKASTNSEIVIIYAIAFGLFAVILVMGFIAAITGLV